MESVEYIISISYIFSSDSEDPKPSSSSHLRRPVSEKPGSQYYCSVDLLMYFR